MKKFLLILSFSVFSLGVNAQCAKEPFVLVELFSSQGCYYCPAADKDFNLIVNANPKANILGLAHHVNYFNHALPGPCGVSAWVDPFSSQESFATQSDYARVVSSTSVGTPEFMVQGEYSSIRNMPSVGLVATINKALSETPKSGVCLNYVSSDDEDNTITVDYELIDTDNDGTENLIIYLFEDKLYNIEITAGENCNKFLDHERIRRNYMGKAIKSSADNTGTITISYPSDVVTANIGVSAFVQNKASRKAVGGTRGFQLSDFITSTNEIISDINTVKVYPNPAKDQVNFALSDDVDFIEILDLTGKVVQSAYNLRSNFYTMDLSVEVTPGMYIFRVGSELSSIAPKTGKLMIK